MPWSSTVFALHAHYTIVVGGLGTRSVAVVDGAKLTVSSMGLLQGIYNLPNCGPNEDDPSDKPTAMCLTIQHLVATGAYLPFIRCTVRMANFPLPFL